MKPGRAIATTFAVLTLFCRIAGAEPLSARDHFQRGVEAFAHRDLAHALEEFTASYEMAALPEVLNNIALTQKELGLLPEALATFERYVAAASARPGGIDPERRKIVTAEITELRTSVGEVRFVVDPAGSNVVIDGKPVAVESPTYVWPGDHDIDVSHDGHRAEHRRLAVPAGVPTVVRIRLELVPSAATKELLREPAPKPSTGGAPLFTGAAAAGALVGGTVLGILALDTRAQYRNGCQIPETCDRGLYDAGRTKAIAADVLFGAAAALSIVTGVLLLTRDSHSAPHR